MQRLGTDATHLVVRSALSPQLGALTLSAAIGTGIRLDGAGKIVVGDARESALFIRPAAFTVEGVPQGVTSALEQTPGTVAIAWARP